MRYWTQLQALIRPTRKRGGRIVCSIKLRVIGASKQRRVQPEAAATNGGKSHGTRYSPGRVSCQQQAMLLGMSSPRFRKYWTWQRALVGGVADQNQTCLDLADVHACQLYYSTFVAPTLLDPTHTCCQPAAHLPENRCLTRIRASSIKPQHSWSGSRHDTGR